MYQVLKILNNNTILAKEGNNEIIILAKGIGFGKKVNDHFEIPPQAKKYMMQKNYQAKDKLKKVIDYINPVYTMFTSLYGFVQFFIPTSMVLGIGLVSLKVKYSDWLKYIWRFLLGMFICLLVIFILMAII